MLWYCKEQCNTHHCYCFCAQCRFPVRTDITQQFIVLFIKRNQFQNSKLNNHSVMFIAFNFAALVFVINTFILSVIWLIIKGVSTSPWKFFKWIRRLASNWCNRICNGSFREFNNSQKNKYLNEKHFLLVNIVSSIA